MVPVIFNLLVGWLGLGVVVSVACFAAWWLIPDVPWLTDRLRQMLLIVGVLTGAGSFIYGKGAYDAAVASAAKIEKEKADAINKANAARERLRRSFDRNPANGVPDRWLRD